jgi:hypothetical protein
MRRPLGVLPRDAVDVTQVSAGNIGTLDDRNQARQWYERAVKAMDADPPADEELRRFRAQAAKLLLPPALPMNRLTAGAL